MKIVEGWSPNENVDIPREDQAKRRLSEWFERYNADVYWEKEDNSEGRDIFETSGATKPDLLVTHPNLGILVCEVKAGTDGSQVYRGAAQIVQYWWDYECDKTSYFIDSDQVKPNVFLLATGNSPLGRLYNDANTKDRLKTEEDMSEGRAKWAVRNNERPQTEHTSSETTTGIIWQMAKQRISQKDDHEQSAGIGSLYSSILDDPNIKSLYPTIDENAGTESKISEFDPLTKYNPSINYKYGSDIDWVVLEKTHKES
ncbi:hypothetical protein [Natronococcus pandeyae]|uniref:hypothetical protein n=1 Tax=Natronococcus pandeyae TaxID=2055836 RepID=UPI0011E7E785|nr:hypothetical protein [Natronococcus pandeyae]